MFHGPALMEGYKCGSRRKEMDRLYIHVVSLDEWIRNVLFWAATERVKLCDEGVGGLCEKDLALFSRSIVMPSGVRR